MQRILALVSLCFAPCVLAPAALAQIEFPDKPVTAPSTPVPVELPAVPSGNLADRGLEKPSEVGGGTGTPVGELGFPEVQVPDPMAATGDPGRIDAGPLGNLPPGRRDAANFILTELRRIENVRHTMVDQAAQSLIGLGDEGREGARMGLMENRAATILACAKVLLSSDKAADRELVRARMRSKLPAAVGGPLVDAFATLDPVGASPSALALLLDHPLVGARAAAQRRLEGLQDAGHLPALIEQLRSSRADTRLRALSLAARFEVDGVVEQVIGRLKDPAAQVAERAALLLAARTDPAIVGQLRVRAFDQPWILRENAYAILALIEREDALLTPCFDERHVPNLLEGLASSDPFIAGMCAAALSGIGFRSTTLGAEDWIDRAVPERLVRCVSGHEFHNDFSSLQRAACRRLSLISGQVFGSDGPLWMKWWTESHASFRSRRAVIAAGPELAVSLRLGWRDELSGLEQFRILGPTATSEPLDSALPFAGDVFRISASQAADVYAMLQEMRVFSAERLPGVRGSSTLPGRYLEVGIGDQGKSFRFAGTATEAWFDTVGAALRAVRDRNRWQCYPSPPRHARAEDLWFEQFAWWDTDASQHERALRMKTLVLEALPAYPFDQRGGGIAELVAIYAERENIADADFPALVELLQQEPFYGPRARALLGLSIAHLGANSAAANARADLLLSVATERFGEQTGEAVTQILAGAGPAAVRAATFDPRPNVRAVAAGLALALGESGDVQRAESMLTDKALSVQVAAVVALGNQRVESARVELLLRARLAEDASVRAAALGAMAELGGEGALDAMVLGLTSPIPAIKVAAARGLARIGDPTAAPLLISLLGQGRGSDVFEAARQGLTALGELATNDLLRAINTPGHRARREGALLLSQLGVPEAVPVLLALFSDSPNDSLIASELAVITCVDLRRAGNPPVAYWDWWEGVVHDDPNAWLCGALERLDVRAPAPKELRAPGSRKAMLFLASLLRRFEPQIVERARRDLGRLLGRDLGALPVVGDDRNLLIAELEREIDVRFPQ